jgi:YihY family inner membrane protein
MARFISALREATLRYSQDGCVFLAQSLAFNALFAMFPLTVLMLSAATLVVPGAEQRVLLFFDTFAPTLHDYVAANLETYIYGRGISSIVALVILLWSGKNLFMALAYALDRALGVPKGRPLVHSLILSLVMLPFAGVALIIAITLPVLFSVTARATGLLDAAEFTHWLAYPISIAVVFAATIALYRWLPNRGVSWGFAIRGGAVVAIAWPALQYAFAQYVTHVDFTHVYGALSAPLVLLLWFYCAGSIFLFGAEYAAAASTSMQGAR